jgi:hypothetical protein
MMKNMADINDKLMDLNKKNRDINEQPKQAQVGTTNNNLFIGSTTDLQRFLQAQTADNVIDMTPRLDDK